jgi:hypothetical protein
MGVSRYFNHKLYLQAHILGRIGFALMERGLIAIGHYSSISIYFVEGSESVSSAGGVDSFQNRLGMLLTFSFANPKVDTQQMHIR